MTKSKQPHHCGKFVASQAKTLHNARIVLKKESFVLSSPFCQQLAKLPEGLRTRFAPSPTGYLHLGHVASALFVWGIAEAIKAKVLVRIEDHDRQRCRPEYTQSLLDDLQWLGLLDLASSEPRVSQQSQHPERYLASWEQLDQKQVVYPCSCSRKDLLERRQETSEAGADIPYDGHCRPSGTKVLRSGLGSRVQLAAVPISFHDLYLGPQEQLPAQQCGDLLLRERIGNWTYNFCVVIDDALENIDFVIRGQDILEASGRQIQLAQVLELAAPRYYCHHPLIWETTGRKLSKRDGSTSLKQLRASGMSAAKVLGLAASSVGLLASEREIEASQIGDIFAWTS